MRLLVVSKDSILSEILSGLCGLWGYEVLIAQQPALVVSMALDARPDVILVDLGTGEEDFWEVALRMRRQRQLETVFLVSLAGRELDRDRTEEAGFDACLVKPLDFQLLKCLLQRRPRPAPRPRLAPLHPTEPDRRRIL